VLGGGGGGGGGGMSGGRPPWGTKGDSWLQLAQTEKRWRRREPECHITSRIANSAYESISVGDRDWCVMKRYGGHLGDLGDRRIGRQGGLCHSLWKIRQAYYAEVRSIERGKARRTNDQLVLKAPLSILDTAFFWGDRAIQRACK